MDNVEPLVHNPAVQNALTDKITTEITTHLNVTAYTDQAAAALTSRGLTRVGALLQTFGPSISSAVTGFIHGQVHKIVTSPQFAQYLGPGQHRCPPGTGQGPVRAGQRIGQRQQRAGRPQPRPVHQPRQAGPGQARFHARQQSAGHQPDAEPVLGQVPGQSAERIPAHQRPQDRAADPDPGAPGPRRVRGPQPPAGPDRGGSRPGRVDGGARRRAADLPRRLPEQRAQRRAARRCGRGAVRHARAVHQGRAAHDPGRRPGRGRWCVPDRAVGERGQDPARLHLGPRLGPAERRARRRADRPGGNLDLRAPQGAPDLGRGAGRAGLRVLGTAHCRRRGGDRHPAAGRPRADRTHRQQAAQPATPAGP